MRRDYSSQTFQQDRSPGQSKPQQQPFARTVGKDKSERSSDPEAEAVEATEKFTPEPRACRSSEPRQNFPGSVLGVQQMCEAPDSEDTEYETIDVTHAGTGVVAPSGTLPARSDACDRGYATTDSTLLKQKRGYARPMRCLQCCDQQHSVRRRSRRTSYPWCSESTSFHRWASEPNQTTGS